MAKEYNATKLHKELEAAGLEIEGVTSEGRVDWKGEPSQADKEKADQVKAAHAAEDPEAVQKKAYLEKGLDAEKLVNALWEKVMEGKSAAADELQLIRDQAKLDIG